MLPHTNIRSQAGTKEKGKENKGNERKKKKKRRKQKKIKKWRQTSNTYALPLLVQRMDVGWNFNNLVTTAFYSELIMEGLSSKNCLDTILNPFHSRKGTSYLPVWQMLPSFEFVSNSSVILSSGNILLLNLPFFRDSSNILTQG